VKLKPQQPPRLYSQRLMIDIVLSTTMATTSSDLISDIVLSTTMATISSDLISIRHPLFLATQQPPSLPFFKPQKLTHTTPCHSLLDRSPHPKPSLHATTSHHRNHLTAPHNSSNNSNTKKREKIDRGKEIETSGDPISYHEQQWVALPYRKKEKKKMHLFLPFKCPESHRSKGSSTSSFPNPPTHLSHAPPPATLEVDFKPQKWSMDNFESWYGK